MMQLFDSSASPFVRTVNVVLLETGQMDHVEKLNEKVTPLDKMNAAVAHNPLGKVPTLIREDGPALYDSRVICRYLDTRVDSGLYPKGDRLWETLTLEATGHGMMEAGIAMVYERRTRPENEQSPTWIEAQWVKASRTLDAIEGRWMSHLAGNIDMAQIAVGCALGYYDLRLDDRNWRATRPELAAWFAEFNQRPSMQATIPA